MKRSLVVLLLIIGTGRVHAGWFGPDHYYWVSTKGGKFYCKGEPSEKDGFMVFVQWPEGGELRVKKELVNWVKDTGTLAPDELEAKQKKQEQELKKMVAQLFPTSELTHCPHFVTQTLAEARKMGATDDQIKEVVLSIGDRSKFTQAFKDYSLDEIAEFFQKREQERRNALLGDLPNWGTAEKRDSWQVSRLKQALEN